MSFASESSKLLTNKYFLYFMVFLSATNILGYLVTNKLNAVIFFALVSLLTYQFSKNMAVILLISIIATNFMMSNKMMREGMDNATSTDSTTTSSPPSTVLDRVGANDGQIGDALSTVQSASSNDDLKDKKQAVGANLSDNGNIDMNNLDLNKSTPEPSAPEGFVQNASKKGQGKTSEHFGPRLDYAATIEQSYQNLDSLLGSDSIKQLTGDTQKLMQQQQNLFNTMNQMVPVLEGAQNMLKGIDMGELSKTFGGLSSLVNAPTAVNKSN
jgi:hypothetical protein